MVANSSTNTPCAPEFYSLSMVSGANSITYTWQLTGQEGVANYRIEKRVVGGTFSSAGTFPVNTRLDDQGFYTYTYTENNLASGQYEYRVVALCSSVQLFPMPNETVNL